MWLGLSTLKAGSAPPGRWRRSNPAGQQPFKLRSQLLWTGGGSKARHHLPLPVDKKLGEVPPDPPVQQPEEPAGLLLLEVLVEGMGGGAIHNIFLNTGKLTP